MLDAVTKQAAGGSDEVMIQGSLLEVVAELSEGSFDGYPALRTLLTRGDRARGSRNVPDDRIGYCEYLRSEAGDRITNQISVHKA